MNFILILVGIVVGSVLESFWGALLGGFLGYVLGELLSIRKRLQRIEDKLLAGSLPAESGRMVTSPPDADEMPAKPPPEPIHPEPPMSPDVPEEPERPPLHISGDPAGRSISSVPDTPIFDAVTSFFTSGNAPVRVGVIVLFFGVAFLFKYAIEHNMLPIELRLIGAGLGAIAMLIFGWCLRMRRPPYALTLQGGAVGILYLTVFAAMRLYHLIPPAGAFGILLVIAALSAALAVMQNALVLAVLGAGGGFLAPILTSTGGGNHVMLFSYYALLNLGILGVAWFKSWRLLNLTGFAFTFIIGSAWGYKYYQPAYFGTTEPFLFFFIGLYALIAILFATRQAPRLKGYVDGTLVFGTPIVGAAMQAGLVKDYEYGLAWSALGLGLFYAAIATVLFRNKSQNLRALTESFLALGVMFGTLVFPLAFDGRWTSAAWAFEGAAMVWIGLRQQRQIARIFGVLLLIASGIAFLVDVDKAIGAWPVMNSFYIGCVVIALSALFGGYYLYRWKDKLKQAEERALSAILLIWGVAWWLGGGIYEIHRHAPALYEANSILVFIALSFVAFVMAARSLSWRALGAPALLLLPIMVLAAVYLWIDVAHPFANGGFIAWPLVFLIFYGLLRFGESEIDPALMRANHVGALWLLAFMLSWETYWTIQQWLGSIGVWSQTAWLLIPAALIYFCTHHGSQDRWPLDRHCETYLNAGIAPMAFLLWGESVYFNATHTGDPWPLPFMPILNPLDLAQMLVFVVLISWMLQAKKLRLAVAEHFSQPWIYGLVAATLFLWLNAVLIRTFHHWGGIEFTSQAMYNSVVVQAALSIFWGILGLIAMVLGTRMKARTVWIGGVILLAIVVAKLFLVDLSKTDTIARIVSFLAVGILLLIVGYLSPAPPRMQQEETAL